MGIPEFRKIYYAAINGEKKQPKTIKNSTLKWLIKQYQKSSDWIDLSPATRR